VLNILTPTFLFSFQVVEGFLFFFFPSLLIDILFSDKGNVFLFSGATGSAVKSESPSTSSIPSLNETVPAASLLTTASQHSSSLSGLSHSEEIPNTTTTQHSR